MSGMLKREREKKEIWPTPQSKIKRSLEREEFVRVACANFLTECTTQASKHHAQEKGSLRSSKDTILIGERT